MVSKSLRMNASASPRGSPELPATPRKFKQRRVKSLTSVEDPKPRKYIHVHHFKNTKLFGAWFNDPSKSGKKVRLFFGSHLTAYLAARAQDRAALKYKPHALDPRSIKLNFKEEDYVDDQKLRKMLTCEEFGELLRKESRPKYTKMEPTPCLRKFLAHERARGNIPSAAPRKEEDIIPLRQYLKEVIQNRDQTDEDMEDPVPSAEQKKQALKMERKKRSEGKRIVASTQPRTPRSPVPGPSECKRARTPRSPVAGPSERKPLVTAAPPPLVWGQTRRRTNREEDEFDKLQYKLQKISIDPTKKSREPGPKIKTEALPTEVEKSLEGAPMEPEGVPTEVKNMKTLEPGNQGLPLSPGSQFRSKWHYNMYKIQKLQTSGTGVEILPTEVENTKTPEPGTGGLPQSSEFRELQYRSKWHSKLHKLQPSIARTSEPSPKNGEGSYLQALAKLV